MTTLKSWLKLDKLSLALAASTLVLTALTRLLPFSWMETASQWGVMALLIAFILGCATLFVMSVVSFLPRTQLKSHKPVEIRLPRQQQQVVPIYAISVTAKLKK